MNINRRLIALISLTLGCAGQVIATTYEERREEERREDRRNSEEHRRHREERREHAAEHSENFGRTLALPFTASADVVTGDRDHYTRRNVDAMEDNHDRVHHHYHHHFWHDRDEDDRDRDRSMYDSN